MPNVQVERNRGRLDHAFQLAADYTDEPEAQGHWARYLCVLVSGFLEVSIREIYSEYCQHRSQPNVAKFVERRLRGLQNLNMERILELTRSFNTEWAQELENSGEGEIKDAIDSIISNRNRIAHVENVGISYVRILEYYRSAIRLIELIDRQCNH